ncbi:Myb-like DNA-binding domain containing protein [Trichomonas vaginalis G3]|uniref:Myb-like DNA-binding domain containing protein n=1 Tax=Trichomonas vaginalis (strain ATCC PRA-98 / G3) TaxID=412133 RepID=A2FTZ6_TRIV3|nr:RNA polymerase II transcription regulator recruiting protein [Trichomonas vaginalis G3]EAX91613.1 Myb-like DNA-binding domain containing protein [Trichomonas vaginalis G3]KAI5509719.1 RNA polymerase II transcription regulator recruiting protein [Trichomonas vaginalis G3]|eukprot:XP_001304543.1 Myb-like DNA-binding domain containing protein [Trichomonas vaginalis G3]
MFLRSKHSKYSSSDSEDDLNQLVIKTHRRRFTPEEDELLKEYVNSGEGHTWEDIARMLNGRTARQCWDRYNNYLYKNLKKDKWTPDEDAIIVNMYNKIGSKWTKIAQMLDGRSGNNVKNRWHKYLSKKVDIQSNHVPVRAPQTTERPAQTNNFEFDVDLFNKDIDFTKFFDFGN